jgi:hypothetical protein
MVFIIAIIASFTAEPITQIWEYSSMTKEQFISFYVTQKEVIQIGWYPDAYLLHHGCGVRLAPPANTRTATAESAQSLSCQTGFQGQSPVTDQTKS